MSLIPSFFTRMPSFGGFDYPSMRALDLFDPFDEIDQAVNRNPLHWFLKPEFANESAMFPRVPQKYRITVDCTGFSPSSIKTELTDNNQRLVVSANEEFKTEGSDDYVSKQFKKTYTLPKHAIHDQMISFMTGNGQLVIELPLRETNTERVSDLFPQILDAPDGGKQVILKFNLPENIDPNKVSVNVKNHDLIFRAEDVVKKPDGVSRFHYFQRTTLPEHAQLESLRCNVENNQVIVTAPITNQAIAPSYRKVPIEGLNQNQSQVQQTQQNQPQIQQTQQKQPTTQHQQGKGQQQHAKTQQPQHQQQQQRS